MPRAVPAACLPLLQEYEQGPHGGHAVVVYSDEGRACIGWGHNIYSPDDPLLTATLTRQQADDLALKDLADVSRRLEAVIGDITSAQISDSRWAALVDFAFNEGIGRFEGSTLYTMIRSGSFKEAASQFDRWVYCKDASGAEVKNARLVQRRADERALWEKI